VPDGCQRIPKVDPVGFPVTLEIYSHEDREARREALTKISITLDGDRPSDR
jgi:hypothetical protein